MLKCAVCEREVEKFVMITGLADQVTQAIRAFNPNWDTREEVCYHCSDVLSTGMKHQPIAIGVEDVACYVLTEEETTDYLNTPEDGLERAQDRVFGTAQHRAFLEHYSMNWAVFSPDGQLLGSSLGGTPDIAGMPIAASLLFSKEATTLLVANA